MLSHAVASPICLPQKGIYKAAESRKIFNEFRPRDTRPRAKGTVKVGLIHATLIGDARIPNCGLENIPGEKRSFRLLQTLRHPRLPLSSRSLSRASFRTTPLCYRSCMNFCRVQPDTSVAERARASTTTCRLQTTPLARLQPHFPAVSARRVASLLRQKKRIKQIYGWCRLSTYSGHKSGREVLGRAGFHEY